MSSFETRLTIAPTFIHDHRPLYDFCSNPSLIWIHGAFGWHQTRDTILRPIFQLSKNVLNAEILTTPLEAYENATSASARKKYTPWEEKTINKLFWRGSSTGDSYSIHKDYDWHRSHRPRLHLWAQREDGESTVWVKRGKEWAPESWSHKRLNEQYLDVGLAGKPHQCKKEDGTCDQMAAEMKEKDRVQPEVAKNYKCGSSTRISSDDRRIRYRRKRVVVASAPLDDIRKCCHQEHHLP